MTMELINRRYEQHEVVGDGAMGIIYRAYDRLEKHFVALKRVRVDYVPSTDSKTTRREYLKAITQEFKLLSSLRHPNIISVLDYGFDNDHSPFYVMELLEESDNLLDYSKSLPIAERFTYLVDLLRALEYLHRRNIIHRDLKPSNVLVTKDNVLKVLDFGLATFKQRQSDENQSGMVGTLAYMSPEAFRGELVDGRADLYAVGIMAHQMFTNKHPFDTSNIPQLLHDTLNTPPNLTVLERTHAELSTIVARLLEKSPIDRYRSAYDVIVQLGKISNVVIPEESHAIRESFLQSSRLVGRREEIEQLSDAFRQSITQNGSLWFVGGESGIGKSRLLDEIRVRAMIENAVVLVGQAEGDMNTPLDLWREPLRRLLITETKFTKQELAILKPFIPDIETLVGHAVNDPQPLSGRADLNRQTSTIANIIKRHAKQQLTVIILEDAHLIPSGLDPLQQILPIVSGLPLLVLVSYRDDEAPHLGQDFHGASYLTLKRLQDAQIAELAESMIGEAGTRSDVVRLLQRETEGNVYFLIEVVRSLAEDAKTLNDIGLTTLPQSVFAGGIQALLMRRFERVSPEARNWLKVASLVGRGINVPLIQALSKMTDAQMEEWLGQCSDVAILNVEEGRWLFVHDKLRQAIFITTTDEEKRQYHGQIAQTLERITPEPMSIAITITEHYAQAQNTAKLAIFAPAAAQHAQRICAYQDVLRFANMVQSPPPSLIKLCGDAYEGLGNYKKAQEMYAKALDIPTIQPNDKIACLNGLSTVGWRKGRYDEAISFAERALELAEQHQDIGGKATALNNLGICASDNGRFALAQAYYEEGLELRQQINDKQGEGYILNSLGIATTHQSKYLEAQSYFERALEVARLIGDRHEVAFAKHGLSMALCNLGEHQKAIQEAKEGMSIAYDLGNMRGIALCSWRLATAEGYANKTNTLATFDEAIRICGYIGDERLLSSVLYDKGSVLFARGDLQESQKVLHEAYTLMQKNNDHIGMIRLFILQGKGFQRQNALIDALSKFEEAHGLARQIESNTHIAETLMQVVYLRLNANALDDAEPLLEEALHLLASANAISMVVSLDVLWGIYWAKRGDYIQAAQKYGFIERSHVKNRSDIVSGLIELDALIAPHLSPEEYAHAKNDIR